MNIIIRNYLSGSFLLQSEPNQWDAIVILDSKTKPSKFISENTLRHLILKFDDICTQHHGKTEPALSHIQSALEFADQSDNLMVCCRARQSRSAALAYILSYHYMGCKHRPENVALVGEWFVGLKT